VRLRRDLCRDLCRIRRERAVRDLQAHIEREDTDCRAVCAEGICKRQREVVVDEEVDVAVRAKDTELDCGSTRVSKTAERNVCAGLLLTPEVAAVAVASDRADNLRGKAVASIDVKNNGNGTWTVTASISNGRYYLQSYTISVNGTAAKSGEISASGTVTYDTSEEPTSASVRVTDTAGYSVTANWSKK